MNKHGLIIGASGAIGSQIAYELGQAGYTLSLHYASNQQAIKETVNRLPEETVLETLQYDLSTIEGIQSCIDAVSFNPDFIIFAQGQASHGLFTEASSDVMHALNTTHLLATWRISQAFLPHMIRQRHGHLIVISSIWAERAASHEVIYSSVKGGQIAFVRSLAEEVASSNIQVNAISPGFIDTKMNDQFSPDERLGLLREIPMGRFGQADDVSHLVTFLLDRESNYLTGENIKLTGGWKL